MSRIGDLHPIFCSHHPDGGGLAEADALTEVVVCLDLIGELASRVYDKGHHATVGLKEVLGEVIEVFLGGDGGLVREDGAAILFGGLGRDLVLDVAGDDGGVAAPDVHLEGEVVADQGNPVVVDGFMNHGKGAGAGGALEVFELVDGDLRSSGWLEHGGVFEGLAGAGRKGGLSDGGGAGEQSEAEGGGGRETDHECKTHRGITFILAADAVFGRTNGFRNLAGAGGL